MRKSATGPSELSLHTKPWWVGLATVLSSSVVMAASPDGTLAPMASSAISGSAAPSAESKQKAMDHFETGLKLYEDGDFSLALIEFERAYSYIPDYRVLYNIGQVSIQLGRFARAAIALQQYLEQGGPSTPKSRLESVRADLKMLEGRTAHLRVDCNVDGAEVLLDDVRIAVTPFFASLLIDAGEHRLTVQKQGYVTRTERLVLAGRDDSKQQIDLAEIPRAAAMAMRPVAIPVQLPPQKPLKELSEPMSRRTKLLYVGAGATGLLGVGWAVTGYVGIKAAGDLHDELKHPTTEGELTTLKNKARGWLLASDILGACALGAGATTLYFTLASPKQEAPRRVGVARMDLGVAPGAVQLQGTFY